MAASTPPSIRPTATAGGSSFELTNGTFEPPGSPATQVTEFGGAHWLFWIDPEGTTATLTELPHEGFELLDAFCVGIPLDGGDDVVVGSLAGDSVTFEVARPIEDYYCRFFNAPSPTPDSEPTSRI